eukprot:TRINITY_DN1918_c1_g1_i2.p1 TRINITY_DN1918_c1_g1~~TRINITY_DN1918_c1_g1_i2.p1  ORF type:complete len:453 (-),score=67.67 TRINITY_DN1918_c1_g1_i2:376-1734(-)
MADVHRQARCGGSHHMWSLVVLLLLTAIVSVTSELQGGTDSEVPPEPQEEIAGSGDVVDEEHLLPCTPADRDYKANLYRHPTPCFPLSGGRFGCLPNYLVLGAMKAGTTFLDRYLQKHPQVVHHQKEIGFFNWRFREGFAWYARHFSVFPYDDSSPRFVGESTPFYLNSPFVADRVLQTIPDVKLIMTLRNPTNRALSQYYFGVEKILEVHGRMHNMTFVEFIDEELEVFAHCFGGGRYDEDYLNEDGSDEPYDDDNAYYYQGGVDPMYKREVTDGADEDSDRNVRKGFFSSIPPHENPLNFPENEELLGHVTPHPEQWRFYQACIDCTVCFPTGNILHSSGHSGYGLLWKSMYYQQVEEWNKYFPMSQIHITSTELIHDNGHKVLNDIMDFMGADEHDFGDLEVQQIIKGWQNVHPPMSNHTRAKLTAFFKPFNQKLYDMVGTDFAVDWDV